MLCLCDRASALRAPVSWLGCCRLAGGLQASGFRLEVGSCACAFVDAACFVAPALQDLERMQVHGRGSSARPCQCRLRDGNVAVWN